MLSRFTCKRLTGALLACIFVSSFASARTVAWYSAIGDVFLKADGFTSWDSSLQFQLGAFKLGFSPTAANIALWQENWLLFDSATYANGQWNPSPPFPNFTSLAVALSAGSGLVRSSVDPAGAATTNLFSIYSGTPATYQQAWIWAFNSKSLAGGSQWALAGNAGWTFPASDVGNPNSVDFFLGEAAAVLGSLTQQTVGMDMVSTFRTVAVSAPEPGNILPLAALLAIFIRRRKRS